MFYDGYMPALVFFEYITWQYGEGIREFIAAWQNIHWFLWRIFSVSLLVRTFFMPFRRTSESYGRGFDPGALAETLLVNVVTRLVGMAVRSVLLVVALLFQAIMFAAGSILFLWFLLAPAAIPLSILVGILIILL